MVDTLPSYPDFLYLMDYLKSYASPKAKLTQMIKARNIIKVKRGIYVWPPPSTYSLKTLANKIYGPSYISFEYALSYHGLIPERVEMITCASMAKNKNKLFNTPVGRFYYKSIPAAVYPYGVARVEEDTGPYLIATPEKALCDTLSKISRISNQKSICHLLFDDLRIDANELASLQATDIGTLVPLYRRKTVSLFWQYFKKEIKHA